ncbi:MAG TPA: ABC transporter ATP-binding protein [Opitutae bacterium]|nr:ABC transporter ATP-binding protein [Opitutae bacterium]
MDPSVLRVDDLHRWLGEDEGRVHVLKGLTFSVERSNVYGIVGPSGCGKSTLLYLLGLLDRPDQGEIWIEGHPMAYGSDEDRTRARNALIGFVFQFHFLLPEFTALENVMLPMQKLGKLSQPEMEDYAQGLLAEVGLGAKSHRMARHLSGGEQQRVAIARSLANDPAVLLTDEPTGNLDVKNSDLVFDLLCKLAHERGQAVLMVTHNNDLAGRCDRLLSLRDGAFAD